MLLYNVVERRTSPVQCQQLRGVRDLRRFVLGMCLIKVLDFAVPLRGAPVLCSLASQRGWGVGCQHCLRL